MWFGGIVFVNVLGFGLIFIVLKINKSKMRKKKWEIGMFFYRNRNKEEEGKEVEIGLWNLGIFKNVVFIE